ncbi:endoplasmic oxidoreductin-1 [Umbelopsis nana]
MADKRIAHNALERQRRENLNTKFQELAHTLPGLQTVRRPSKSMIVTKSLEFVSQAKYREMKFQQELNQLRKQQKRLLSENQYLRTITNNARSDQTVGSMASNISYASKESPPLSPESSISGNHEIDFDGSLDSSHMHHNSLSDDLERSMDETTTEDLPFQVPVCNAPDAIGFHPMYWTNYSNLSMQPLIAADFGSFPSYACASDDSNRVQFLEDVLDMTESQDYCNPTGVIRDSCCDIQTVEGINQAIAPILEKLVSTKFFRYYKLNLWKECPFWPDDGLCMNRDCSVSTIDEGAIPLAWRQDALGKVHTVSSSSDLFGVSEQCQYKDQDFCLVENEADSEGVYVDLSQNPERFTGYAGASAARVWKSIYEENCFNIVHKMTEGCETCNNIMNTGGFKPPTESSGSGVSSPIENPFAMVPNSRKELDRLLNDLAEDPDSESEEVCLEKRVFYRVISGLHSSISIHICDDYFNQTTGEWRKQSANLDCFVSRIGSHPERLQNVYFTHTLLMRALIKLSDYLNEYTFCTGNTEEEAETKALKEEFKEHFRNVTRIMDCVGCEKCKLWGKLQTTGLGTALKILFSYEDKSLNARTNPGLFERSEIIALINTINRFSESLRAIDKFRKMYQAKINPNQNTRALLGTEESTNNTFMRVVSSTHENLTRCVSVACRWAATTMEKFDIPVPQILKTFALR